MRQEDERIRREMTEMKRKRGVDQKSGPSQGSLNKKTSVGWIGVKVYMDDVDDDGDQG